MRWGLAAIVVCILSPTALADDKPGPAAEGILGGYLMNGSAPLRFAFHRDGTTIDGGASMPGGAYSPTKAVSAVIGIAALEPSAAWFAADFESYTSCAGIDTCTKKPDVTRHATVVIQKVSGSWVPLALCLPDSFTAKAQSDAIKSGAKLKPLPNRIDKGAEPAAKLFSDSRGDPKALAATISARPEVAMFGSSAGERWTGGAAVKAQLVKWKLAFKVRDGIQAGASKGGKVAWVAANVDALTSPKAAATPYRVLAVYEQTAAGWQLVVLQFSFYATRFEN